MRSASLQTPHLGNAMKEGLPATKPTPPNDSNALGGGMEAVGDLDVAVVAVKNVPALPSLPHAFEVACTIGVDGMVSTLSLSRSSLSFSFLSFLSSLFSLSLSLFSLFSLFSLSLSHTTTQVSTTADVPWAPEMSFDQEFRFMVASTTSTVTLSILARAFTGADGELLGTCSVDVDGLLRGGGTQVCGMQMCFAQGLGCECEYARVAPADMDVLACGSFICTGQAPLVGWHYIHGPKGPQADVIGTPVGVFLRLYVMCVRASSVNAHAHPPRSRILARAHTLYPHAQSQSRPQVPARLT